MWSEMPAVVLATNTPLTERQRTFLRAHILKQRMKEQQGVDEQCAAAGKPGPGEGEEGGGGGVTAERDPGAAAGEGRHGSEPSDPNGREHSSARESEGETLNDIKKQIGALQGRLESLREEKHRLFQQLKMVLHEEEDERKKSKESEDKQEAEKAGLVGEAPQPDLRLVQALGGLKRPLPCSTASSVLAPPPMKQHRGPLLPTPDAFSRPVSVGSHFSGPPHQVAPPPHQQHFSPRGPMRPSGFQEPRFSHPHLEIRLQAPPAGTHDHHLVPRPPLTPQATPHGMSFSQPHPHMHEQMQPQQFPAGVPMASYQFASSHFAAQPSPSAQQANQSMQVGFQSMAQQGYIQSHPHEVHMQGQPHPHEVHMLPYAQQPSQPLPHDARLHTPIPAHHAEMQQHYIAPQGQLLTGQGYEECGQGGAQGGGVGFGGHVQDPRHQKLLAEHQRSGSAVTSPKQDGGSRLNSPSQSPAHSSTREKRHSKK